MLLKAKDEKTYTPHKSSMGGGSPGGKRSVRQSAGKSTQVTIIEPAELENKSFSSMTARDRKKVIGNTLSRPVETKFDDGAYMLALEKIKERLEDSYGTTYVGQSTLGTGRGTP